MGISSRDRAFLERVPLTSELTLEQAEKLGEYFDATEYEPGQVILWEGHEHDTLAIIADGSVVVTKVVRGEVESVLCRLKKGDHFGELDLIDSRSASATVTAEEATRVLAISQDRLRALFRDDPATFGRFAWAMMRDLAAKLRATNKKVLEAVEWGLEAASLDPTD